MTLKIHLMGYKLFFIHGRSSATLRPPSCRWGGGGELPKCTIYTPAFGVMKAVILLLLFRLFILLTCPFLVSQGVQPALQVRAANFTKSTNTARRCFQPRHTKTILHPLWIKSPDSFQDLSGRLRHDAGSCITKIKNSTITYKYRSVLL